MLSTEFLLTSLVVVLVPGTGVIYTVSTGLFLGWRTSIAAAIGCTIGIVPHLCACIFGLSAILHTSAIAFQLLKYAGSVYLLYLAWTMWRDTGSLQFNQPVNRGSFFKTAVRGVLINILNPKLSIFFLAFLPLFISPQASTPIRQMILLSGVFMGMTLMIFILYGILASRVSTYFSNSMTMRRWLQRSFAVIFGMLAAKLALSEP